MVLTQNQKGLSSIIGGIIFNLGIGSVFPLATFNVYIISYLNNFHPNEPYPLSYGFFITPIITFIMALFGPIGGLLDYNLGCHLNMGIGILPCICGAMILYFVKNLSLMYFGICLYGMGCGLVMMAPMKNACFYFPNKKGIVSSCMFSFIGVGGAFYNYFGESMINPSNIQLKDDEVYYDFSIAQNTLKYYMFQAIIMFITSCIGMLFVFRYQVETIENKIPSKEEKLINDSSSLEKSISNTHIQDGSIEPKFQNKIKIQIPKPNNPFYKSEIIKVLKTKRIWILFLTNFFSGFLVFSVRSTYKVIGTTRQFSIESLKIAAVGGAIGLSLFSPVWGLLYDVFGFRYLIMILNASGVATGIMICFSMNSEVFFVCLVLLSTTLIAGIMALFPPHTMKVFGIKYATELGGIMGLSPALSNVFGCIYAFVVSKYFSTESIMFYIVYLIGAAFNLISIFLACLENGVDFDYERNGDSNIKTDNSDASLEPKVIQ